LQYVKALGIDLKDRGQVQVSMNLINYAETPLFRAFELVRREAERYGVPVVGSEIVGLVPQAALNDCADFYLRCENFSEDVILEKRLQDALAARALQVGEPTASFRDEFNPDEWLGAFIDDVAAGSLTPGGGSVAAYAGALSAALGKLVCNLTLGKRKYEDVEMEVRDVFDQLEQLDADLRAAVAEDADSQERLTEVMQLPRGSEAERLARTGAIEEATKGLVSLRLRVAEGAMEALDLLDELAEVGNPVAYADLSVGAQLALTAIRGAAYQVFSNLSLISEEDFTHQRRAELDELIARGQEVADAIEERFFQIYPR
jgi:glutamate formiminotransferase/formiminotetrahydrofolate cyclodeaminase